MDKELKALSLPIEERIQEMAIDVGNNCVNFYGNEVDFCYIEYGLRQIATEQEVITQKEMIDKAGKAFCETCLGQCKDRLHCDTLQRFINELKAL